VKTNLFYPLSLFLAVLTLAIACRKTSEPGPFIITSLGPEQGTAGKTVTLFDALLVWKKDKKVYLSPQMGAKSVKLFQGDTNFFT